MCDSVFSVREEKKKIKFLIREASLYLCGKQSGLNWEHFLKCGKQTDSQMKIFHAVEKMNEVEEML